MQLASMSSHRESAAIEPQGVITCTYNFPIDFAQPHYIQIVEWFFHQARGFPPTTDCRECFVIVPSVVYSLLRKESVHISLAN